MLVDNLTYEVNQAEQRSFAWYQARVGYISGSSFKCLTNDKSVNYTRYIFQKATEILLNSPQEDEVYINKYIQYGIDTEPKARMRYQEVKNIQVKESGFCYYPTLHIGCSPDGITSDGGLIEIKCRQPYKHLQFLCLLQKEEPLQQYDPDAYFQCLYNMYVMKAPYVDYIQYNDNFKDKDILIYRIERKQEDMDMVNEIIKKAIDNIKYIIDSYYDYE